MWAVMVFGGTAVSIYFDLKYFRDIFFNLPFHIVSFATGFVILQGVLRIAKNTGRYLARNGREGNIKRLQTNKLVTDGFYGCMRHPMHFGLIFFPEALAFIIGSPFFILIVAPAEIIFMLIMIKFLEEKEAVKKFGQAYTDYKEKVPFFSLKKECLKKLLKK